MHIRVWKGLGEFFTKKNKTKIQIEIKVIVFLFVFFCFGLDIGWHPELNYSFALFLSFLLLLFCAQSVGGHLKIHTRNKPKEAKKGPYAWKGTQNSYRFLSPFTIQRNSLGLVVCHFDFFLLFIAWARWQIDAPCSHIFKGESLTLWYLKKKKTQIFETNLLKRSIHFAFFFFFFCFFFFQTKSHER